MGEGDFVGPMSSFLPNPRRLTQEQGRVTATDPRLQSEGVCATITSEGSLHSKMALLSPTLDMVVTAVGSLLLFMLALGLLCFFTCRLARPLR